MKSLVEGKIRPTEESNFLGSEVNGDINFDQMFFHFSEKNYLKESSQLLETLKRKTMEKNSSNE